jgi:hypothetical protein
MKHPHQKQPGEKRVPSAYTSRFLPDTEGARAGSGAEAAEAMEGCGGFTGWLCLLAYFFFFFFLTGPFCVALTVLEFFAQTKLALNSKNPPSSSSQMH